MGNKLNGFTESVRDTWRTQYFNKRARGLSHKNAIEQFKNRVRPYVEQELTRYEKITGRPQTTKTQGIIANATWLIVQAALFGFVGYVGYHIYQLLERTF